MYFIFAHIVREGPVCYGFRAPEKLSPRSQGSGRKANERRLSVFLCRERAERSSSSCGRLVESGAETTSKQRISMQDSSPERDGEGDEKRRRSESSNVNAPSISKPDWKYLALFAASTRLAHTRVVQGERLPGAVN